jgi:hypothetical protein
VRVCGVGLAALTGGEDPGAGGQLAWDVDDLLAVGEQTVGDAVADAGAAFDRPHPVWPLIAVAQHRGVALSVGAEPPPPWMTSSVVIISIVAERLGGSIPINNGNRTALRTSTPTC